MKKKREKNRTIIATLCVTVVLLFFASYNGNNRVYAEEITKMIYKELISYSFPLFTYLENESSEISISQILISYLMPFIKEKQKMADYETQMESELSYERILAMEAAAENYIDETTGELIVNLAVTEETQQPDTVINVDVLDDEKEINEKKQKEMQYAIEKLNDFDYLIQNFYRIDKTTTIKSSELNASEMLKKDMTITHDADGPKILIYHTHSQEAYVDSISGDSSTTVVGVGDYLEQILEEKYGLNVIHHKGEYDVEKRDSAYSLAGPAIEQILAENPSIEVVIDLHRDGVGEGTRLVTTIDGIKMAKVMFVNGLSRTTKAGNIGYLYNPNLESNLAFSFQMQLSMAEYYPGLSRGIYLKGYRFNLHYCPKSLLVEVGAETNTLEEAKNAMIPLADVLNKVVRGENKD